MASEDARNNALHLKIYDAKIIMAQTGDVWNENRWMGVCGIIWSYWASIIIIVLYIYDSFILF